MFRRSLVLGGVRAARSVIAYYEGRHWPRYLALTGEDSKEITGWTLQATKETDPHPVVLDDYPRDADDKHYQQTLVYKASFEAAADDLRDAATLIFGGVDGDPLIVELNGQKLVKRHPIIYSWRWETSPFMIDVSGKLRAGKNELKVTVEKASGPRGIHQPVYLKIR